MTTLPSARTIRPSRALLASLYAVGITLFVLCTADQLGHGALTQSWPSLLGYALFFLVGMPTFSTAMFVIWKHQSANS